MSMSIDQIQSLICQEKRYHPDPITGKHLLSHYQVGERRCRKCMSFFKVEYKGRQCPKCKQDLAYNSSYRRREHDLSLITEITPTKYKIGKYKIFYHGEMGWLCDCMGFTFRRNCWHIKAIKQRNEEKRQ